MNSLFLKCVSYFWVYSFFAFVLVQLAGKVSLFCILNVCQHCFELNAPSRIGSGVRLRHLVPFDWAKENWEFGDEWKFATLSNSFRSKKRAYIIYYCCCCYFGARILLSLSLSLWRLMGLACCMPVASYVYAKLNGVRMWHMRKCTERGK